MHAEFWHQRWQYQQIGFHLDHVNPHLLNYVGCLELATNSHVFLPLCGKTLDIAWLLAQGYQVSGIELSEIAVEALFDGLGLTPTIQSTGCLRLYQSGDLRIWQGDFFALTAAQLGTVNAVYDRAALIALPDAMRADYARHLRQLTHPASQLLVTMHYDTTLHQGPPFCVSAEEVQQHYAAYYAVARLAEVQIAGGLKGRLPAHEQVWHLQALTV